MDNKIGINQTMKCNPLTSAPSTKTSGTVSEVCVNLESK